MDFLFSGVNINGNMERAHQNSMNKEKNCYCFQEIMTQNISKRVKLKEIDKSRRGNKKTESAAVEPL